MFSHTRKTRILQPPTYPKPPRPIAALSQNERIKKANSPAGPQAQAEESANQKLDQCVLTKPCTAVRGRSRSKFYHQPPQTHLPPHPPPEQPA